MKLETFFEKFDLFADAPDAIAKLRELLTHAAVNGRLVPNDPNEKPIGLNLAEPSGQQSALPSNWRFGLLGDVFLFEYGNNLPAPKRSQSGEYPVYGSNGVVGTHDSYLTKEPAIIVGRKGSAGALNIATGPSWTTDVAYFVRPPKDLDLRFTYYLFSSLQFADLGKGIKPGLSRKEVYELPIALPPLAEQRRIVAKVDELMELCDRLDAQQQERETQHAALARASLSRFAEAPTPANLDLLFYKSYSICPAELRKSILTLAVQGKLVPQDPNDEPVEYDREYNSADIVEVTSERLPKNWGSAMLADVAERIVDCPHSTPKWTESGKLCIRTSQFTPGFLDLTESKFVSDETFDERVQRLRPQQDDILYSREGGILGVACRVPQDVELCLGQRMMLIRSGKCATPSFLEMVLNAPLITEIARQKTTGGAAPRVNVAAVKAYPIPLPPLAEQRRIVEKVDELMALVDALETQLATTHSTGATLMKAAVTELTAAA